MFENTIATGTDDWVTLIYSAVHQESNICQYGRIRTVSRFSSGMKGCGPSRTCRCTGEKLATATRKFFANNPERVKEISASRKKTMKERYGFEVNAQRPEMKGICGGHNKFTGEIADKLNSLDWMNEQYVVKQRTLVDIGKELCCDYGTVAEYARKLGIKIRGHFHISMQERQLAEYLKSLGIRVESNDREIIHPKELDIVLPDYKIAIEVNGLRYHSWAPGDPKAENINRHAEKSAVCRKMRYDLIHITDHEWLNAEEKVKSLMKAKLGLSEKISASKCRVVKVDRSTARDFIQDNDFVFSDTVDMTYGLTYINELIQIMVIKETSDGMKITNWCSKLHHNVKGGMSKLFNHSKKQHPGQVFIVECDLSKHCGNSLISMGFVEVEIIKPECFWNDGSRILPSYKDIIRDHDHYLKTYDSNLTESENMFNNGYRRYFNCGKCVLEYRTNQ